MSDLIERQRAIEAIKTWGLIDGLSEGQAIEILADEEKLPPAQPERQTGRWEYVDYGGYGNYHCSACRRICICNGDYDYCPNCGARLEGE